MLQECSGNRLTSSHEVKHSSYYATDVLSFGLPLYPKHLSAASSNASLSFAFSQVARGERTDLVGYGLNRSV